MAAAMTVNTSPGNSKSWQARRILKMLDLEAAGLKKIDNYQNFAKAFRLSDYKSLMATMKPDSAR